MIPSRYQTLSPRSWCVIAVAFNLVLWASVIGAAELASKLISSAS